MENIDKIRKSFGMLKIRIYSQNQTLVKIYWSPIIPIIGKKSRVHGYGILPIIANYCNNIGTNNCLPGYVMNIQQQVNISLGTNNIKN
jgi:hypothetical protein